jgi:DNA repair exonuclease SbcCD ATPase subunit
LIVDRIIELAVENALKNSRPQDVPDVTDMVNDIQAKAQVIKELSENLQMKTEDIDFLRGNLEKQTNDYQRTFHALEDLKKFTKSQSDKVQEQDQIILKLRQQLEERTHVVIGEQEARQVVQLVATPNFINRDSELIQSLVQQLQGGVSKVQLQHRQIAALQGQISTDETALKAKDETIRQLEEKLATTEQSVKTLRENVEKLKARPSLEELTVEQENEIKLLKYEVKRLKGLLDTLSLRVSEHEHTSAHQKEKELSHLRTEVKELQESLRTEKQNAEANMRAYMRASIHALKKHRAASSGTGNHE